MENSEEEKRRGEETYYLYSPCSLFQQLVKACFKCLGREEDDDDEHSATPPAHANSPSGTEGKEPKRTEDGTEGESMAARVRKSPPRPPIDTGRGGQTN